MVDVECHPVRNYTHHLKNVLNLFACIKLKFFLKKSFFIWFIVLVDIKGTKPAPGDHESNFKKVGAIPCGCITKWTQFNRSLMFKVFVKSGKIFQSYSLISRPRNQDYKSPIIFSSLELSVYHDVLCSQCKVETV